MLELCRGRSMRRFQWRPVILAALATLSAAAASCSLSNPDAEPTSGERAFDVGGGGLPFIHGTVNFNCETGTVTATPAWPDQIVPGTSGHAIRRSSEACPVPRDSPANTKCEKSAYRVALTFRYRSDANHVDQGEYTVLTDPI